MRELVFWMSVVGIIYSGRLFVDIVEARRKTSRCLFGCAKRNIIKVSSERGVFTWPEWAAALAAEIKRAQQSGGPDTGSTYYSHWLNALEKLVAEKGLATPETLHRYRDAWDRACDRTPHGQPIELRKEDFA